MVLSTYNYHLCEYVNCLGDEHVLWNCLDGGTIKWHCMSMWTIRMVKVLWYIICDWIWKKNFCMRFFLKIEFDVWLISSTIELTCAQVSDQLHASLWCYLALFVIMPPPIIIRHCYACVWCFCILCEVNYMDLSGAVQNECKDWVRVKFQPR